MLLAAPVGKASKTSLDRTAVDWLMTIHSGYLHSALPPIYRFWGLGCLVYIGHVYFLLDRQPQGVQCQRLCGSEVT